ncbi:MAG TPA: hypothetical protein PKV80_21660 [Leptospiraceae bacterium]|nr:hypothetical protein [Leptospiraceae bacterium]HNM04833.1 hypothetical protein [Leptospiraceae bacterium]
MFYNSAIDKINSMEFRHLSTICKADFNGRDGKTQILIKASSEFKDREGDTILQDAYRDKSMQQEFIRDGILDWQHMTDYYDAILKSAPPAEINTLMREREKAVIGRPTEIGFKDDFPSEYNLESGKLYARGYLINENEYVQEIIKKLRAGYDGLAASVMGDVDRVHKANGVISKVKLKKIALAQRLDVMNPDTSVSLIKGRKILDLSRIAKGLIHKSNGYKIESMEEEFEEQALNQRIAELEARLEAMEGKLGMAHSYIMNQPDFYSGMVDDLNESVSGAVVPIGYENIKSILTDKYYCPDDLASTLAQNYIVELSIRNKNDNQGAFR